MVLADMKEHARSSLEGQEDNESSQQKEKKKTQKADKKNRTGCDLMIQCESIVNCGPTPDAIQRMALASKNLKENDNDCRNDVNHNLRIGENRSDEKFVRNAFDDIAPFSDLSNPDRRIWVVTTAALPWRTGTAINPLLRALYLTRGRSKGYVTLVIPWLTDLDERAELYSQPPNKIFQKKSEQEQWIRQYAINECKLPEETQKLDIMFYPAHYWKPFGSIFPMVDICSMIPKDKADVAILEEPEHLNWLRVPNRPNEATEIATSLEKHQNRKLLIDNNKSNTNCNHKSSMHPYNETDTESNNIRDNQGKLDMNSNINDVSIFSQKEERSISPFSNSEEHEELGWAHKFNFVVGVIHTNYAAYMKQYGLGTSIIGAPAISAISGWVVRAYCHKVIRLSDVIPSYAKGKEITCNIHGVRSDFLHPDNTPKELSSASVSTNAATTHDSQKDITDKSETKYCDVDNRKCSGNNDNVNVYFIGKLLWAKGFDKMLKVQDIYRQSEGAYFPIDVYGNGPDKVSIQRAFHGRIPKSNATRRAGIAQEKKISIENNCDDTISNEKANSVLSNPESLRRQLFSLLKEQQSVKTSQPYDDAKNYINMGFEVIEHNDEKSSENDDTNHNESNSVKNDVAYVIERKESKCSESKMDEGKKDNQNENSKNDKVTSNTNDANSTASILVELSGKSIQTGIATTQAVKLLADTAISMVFSSEEVPNRITKKSTEHGEMISNKEVPNAMASEKVKEGIDSDNKKAPASCLPKQHQSHYVLDLPKSRFEWRRNPIPARFLGVKDHAKLRDNSNYKIFLNTSVTEVLCTTTAEALAMGKFVIIPHHPSNHFFLQFPNCLAFHTLNECAEKLQWAMKNEPTPLTEEYRHIFTWEAATERLVHASAVTEREITAQKELGMDVKDARLAWLHYRGGENVGGLVSGKLFQ